MHSLSSRFNTVFLFTATVLGAMCALNALSGWLLFRPQAPIKFQVKHFEYFDQNPRFRWDEATFRFDIEANLSSLYTWNLKQLYFYLEAEYTFPKDNLASRAILFDRIFQVPYNRSEVGHALFLNRTNVNLKYPLRDVYRQLQGQNVTLRWRVEYMPITGYFFKHTLHEEQLQLPSKYIPRK